MPLLRLVVILFIFTGLLTGCLNLRSVAQSKSQSESEKPVVTTTLRDSIPVVPEKRAVLVLQPVDTLITTLLDDKYDVVGKRNLIGSQQGKTEVKVPLNLTAKDSLIAIAYWVGFGENSINAYEALDEEIPDKWRQPGVSAPLAAFGAGYRILLPPLGMEEVVRYDFVRSNGKKAFTKGQTPYTNLIERELAHPNYGIISGTDLINLRDTVQVIEEPDEKMLNFYFTYANNHQVNSYPIQLKLIAYYQISELRKTWQRVIPD